MLERQIRGEELKFNPIVAGQIESSIQNSEIVNITLRYLEDERHSDIQALLLDVQTRPLIIGQLRNISDRAYRSLVSSLIEGPEKIHSIGGLQARVDALGDEMIRRGSSLYIESRHKKVSDPDYRRAEWDYRQERKTREDLRWIAWDPNSSQHYHDTQSILAEAATRQREIDGFLEEVQQKTGLQSGSVINISQRVKGITSLFNKIARFRDTSWGADSTIADAVDLLGARLVVSDLRKLEQVMQSIEVHLKDHPELAVLRKENKFIVNHKGSDPYRAIHYVIALPKKDGQLHSFELQLSTLPALVAGDLAHDAIYKPHLLNLPGELQQVVRDYNWESDERELAEYLETKTVVISELSEDQLIEKAIAELDYNAFYDLLLSQIDLRRPLDEKTKNYLCRFHSKEVEKLERLQESDEETIIELAQAAHDGYFRKNSRFFYNLTSDQLGSSLSQEAVELLTPEGRIRYVNRYEVFNGSNNKLSVDNLDLHKLTDEQSEHFFTAAYKDLSVEHTKLRLLVERIKTNRGKDEASVRWRQSTFVMNLNHAPFKTLLALTEEDNPNAIQNRTARDLFRKTLIASQIKAVATASLLTEIGGFDKNGYYRDLSVEALEGSGYTAREMLTHMFFITANRPSSETAPLSFEQFAESPAMAWARDNDKSVDRAVLIKLVTRQLLAIEQAVTTEENPVLIARYQKARYELISKYMRIMVTVPELSEQIINYVGAREKLEVRTLLDNNVQSAQLVKRVKDPLYFVAFVNHLVTLANVPSVFD